VGVADGAEPKPLFQQRDQLPLPVDLFLRHANLRRVGGVVDGGCDDIRRQGQIGRLQLEALIFGAGEIGFDAAALAAEQIRRERDRH
jgi:hypothetical protein